MNIGVVVIIVLLVPILFQLLIQGQKAEKRHSELLHRLGTLESRVKEQNGPGEK